MSWPVGRGGDLVVIQRSRLADQVHDELRARIVAGDLRPGAHLSVPALAVEFELSRSPVREAVQRLVTEGLATEQPHHGAVVTVPDLVHLAHQYEVRAALEGLSAERAAAGPTRQLVADLERNLRAHATAFDRGDALEIVRLDKGFHARILQAARNPALTQVLEPLQEQMVLAMAAGELRTWPRQALVEHRAVVAALAEGNRMLAREAMTQHVLRVREGLLGKQQPGGLSGHG